MPADVVETAKILASLVGAGMGAVGAVSINEYLDRRRLREKEYQTRWLPLYGAAQDLKERLQCLTSIYKMRPLKRQWNNYKKTIAALTPLCGALETSNREKNHRLAF